MTKEEIRKKAVEIRHQLHMIAEPSMQEYESSRLIADTMKELGFDVTEGIGGTGVVATLKCGDSDRMIGLRADIDAIPVTEDNDLDYKSTNEGFFHGCGHDSHAASLVGAALLLKESRDFNGTAVFIFQPGEETGYGARAMIEDGLLEKFPISEIYAQHNDPLSPNGLYGVRKGIASSSEDHFFITIKGRGGHASAPHTVKDPIAAAAEIITALQTIVSRSVSPLDSCTVSCCDIKTDGVMNVIPSTVTIIGDCRAFKGEVQDLIESRMRAIVQHVCEMNDCGWEFEYERVYAPLMNDSHCVDVVVDAMISVAGEEYVIKNCDMMTASEDFAWFQQKVPGAFFFVGHSDASKIEPYPVHSPKFIYNDDAILNASEVFAEIIRKTMPV